MLTKTGRCDDKQFVMTLRMHDFKHVSASLQHVHLPLRRKYVQRYVDCDVWGNAGSIIRLGSLF